MVLGPTIFILGVIGDVVKSQGVKACAFLSSRSSKEKAE
jgi:hypothetical protein